jgi:hypothetical protein
VIVGKERKEEKKSGRRMAKGRKAEQEDKKK